MTPLDYRELPEHLQREVEETLATRRRERRSVLYLRFVMLLIWLASIVAGAVALASMGEGS